MSKLTPREGKLAPHRDENLRWIVEGKWAFGFGIKGMLEIFSAHHDSQYKSGYHFTFKYTFYNWQDCANTIPLLGYANKGYEEGVWESLVEAVTSIHFKELMERQVIPSGFTPEAQEAINKRMGGK